MNGKEITEPGFYWWQCPIDAGPMGYRGRPKTIVQVGVEPFGMKSHPPCINCFFPGNPLTFITAKLPGEFSGPIVYDLQYK